MSKREKAITAAELLARMQSDEETARTQRARADLAREQVRLILDTLQPVLDDLAVLGIRSDSLEDVAGRYGPLSADVGDVLRSWLPRLDHPRAAEQVVRLIGAVSGPVPGRELAELFDATQDMSLRWAIANTLSLVSVSGIAQWLQERAVDPNSGKAREMLLMAALRLLPAEISADIARRSLDEHPGHAAMVLGEVGTIQDVKPLSSLRLSAANWIAREIDAAVSKIRARER